MMAAALVANNGTNCHVALEKINSARGLGWPETEE